MPILPRTQIYRFQVSQPWFTLIKDGDKNVEGRLNREEFKGLKPLDVIIWTDGSSEFKTQVVYTQKFKSFRDMLKQCGLKYTLPGVLSFKSGIDIYRQYYTREEEVKFGVLSIHLRLLEEIDELKLQGRLSIY